MPDITEASATTRLAQLRGDQQAVAQQVQQLGAQLQQATQTQFAIAGAIRILEELTTAQPAAPPPAEVAPPPLASVPAEKEYREG